MIDHPAFADVVPERKDPLSVDFDWQTLEGAIDGKASPDAIEQARRDGAELAIARVLDLLIVRDDLGHKLRASCYSVGVRALLLAIHMRHPSVAGVKNLASMAKRLGVLPWSVQKTNKKLKAKIKRSYAR